MDNREKEFLKDLRELFVKHEAELETLIWGDAEAEIILKDGYRFWFPLNFSGDVLIDNEEEETLMEITIGKYNYGAKQKESETILEFKKRVGKELERLNIPVEIK